MTLSVQPNGKNHFNIRLSAEPDSDIVKWGLAVDAASDEYYTGLIERVVEPLDVDSEPRWPIPSLRWAGASEFDFLDSVMRMLDTPRSQ